jgi:hypothetical protein
MIEPIVAGAAVPTFEQRWDAFADPRTPQYRLNPRAPNRAIPLNPVPDITIEPGSPARRPPWGSGGRITQIDPMILALQGFK